MMNKLGFIGWLFDVTRWESYTKRYVLYLLLGIAGSFVTPYAGMLTAGLLLIDFTIDMLKEKYRMYLHEMEPAVTDEAGVDARTTSKMMME